ncbi:MAG TPA: P-loop NTPase fold protein [Verrucomicrobiae bacterium]|nr:P-loop NTPase fold protein [Verrucomicrobiae bacterium]
MWSDNETNKDFLNFRTIADTAAEIIFRTNGKPLSMGISGGWGVGKSSMVKLIRESLHAKFGEKFVFVDFNAWLYQGYDDAKAALMEVIGDKLVEHSKEKKAFYEDALEFVRRINFFRAAGLTARVAAAIKTVGVSEVAIRGAMSALKAEDGLSEVEDVAKKIEAGEQTVKEESKGLLKARKIETPPKEIHDLRDHFAKLLVKMDVTLVVFVDDLDRCLPDTTISTLEAMRLFLFMDRTAFVIAADEKMIRQAVRAHFKDTVLDDDLVTNYFDKLIQIPIRVPPLGTQEVRAYLFLLFIENSLLLEEGKNAARLAICKQLGESWQGKRVDRTFVQSLIENCPPELISQFELADRISPIMTSAQQIRGNPRLIKRFLNTLNIRLLTAKAQQVTVDEAALTKMLLFERCGNELAYVNLLRAVNEDGEGKPGFLKAWEISSAKGEEIKDLSSEWNSDFAKEWLALSPQLHDLDLRSVAYVSREHLPIINRADQLSADGTAAFEALMVLKNKAAAQQVARLKSLGSRDLGIIMDRLLVKAKTVEQWGVPNILHSCLAVVDADATLGSSLSRFLNQIPAANIKASIVPLLKPQPWSQDLFAAWSTNVAIHSSVKNAIKTEQTGK